MTWSALIWVSKANSGVNTTNKSNLRAAYYWRTFMLDDQEIMDTIISSLP